MKVLSQVGVYVGIGDHVRALPIGCSATSLGSAHRFALTSSSTAWRFGFMMPLYAAYEFVARGVLGGIGMSSFGAARWPTQTG